MDDDGLTLSHNPRNTCIRPHSAECIMTTIAGEALHTVLAPTIRIEALKDAQLFGLIMTDFEGQLTPHGLCLFWATSSLLFCSLVYYLGRFYSPLLFQCYGSMSVRDQREWDVRYSSMPHSFLCVWYAYIMLWNSNFFYEEGDLPNIKRTHAITYSLLGMSFGYLVVDFVVCLRYHMGGNEMLLHHVGSLSSVSAAILTGHGHMHAMWMAVTEFTTPFINFRWWFDKAGMKSSPLYVYNGICILLGWFVARILVFPPFFYIVYVQREQIKYLTTFTKLLFYTFPPILYALNIWWFYKIVKGAIKVLGKPKAKKA